MPRSAGHAEGARRAREAVEACRELGVEVTLTVVTLMVVQCYS